MQDVKELLSANNPDSVSLAFAMKKDNFEECFRYFIDIYCPNVKFVTRATLLYSYKNRTTNRLTIIRKIDIIDISLCIETNNIFIEILGVYHSFKIKDDWTVYNIGSDIKEILTTVYMRYFYFKMFGEYYLTELEKTQLTLF